MLPNHFVCTLGQARGLTPEPKPYRTIGEFVSYQAQNNGHLPAVGFPIPRPGNEPWAYQVFTFKHIDRGTRAVAHRLLDVSKHRSQTVALLAHSSLEFLLTWLALIRLGHSVLLIAPQCQPSAIVHLCKSCQVSSLLYDDAHVNRAKDSVSLATDQLSFALSASLLPFSTLQDASEAVHQEVDIDDWEAAVPDDTAVAYLHHTSGTSSGLPKPIPQTHRAAIGVLPRLQETPSKATFTTTPLYHGGIADLFRSWTSDSCIWLFPGKEVPITAWNICRSLNMAVQSSASGNTPRVAYFSSVPYVLQMMEADESGLSLLRSLDIVGVGGAALPAEVGDRLVAKDVNLISRFGSAECGFLLSSYRDFGSDKEWQYLRNYNPRHMLTFSPHDGDLSELVVRPGWPHMAKTNRPDGSFATADLFAAHPTIDDAWLYHSRADSQLTLLTGKKFDPAPLEAAIAVSPYLDDVLIFGNRRPMAGALLIRSKVSESKTEDELLQELKPLVAKLNKDSQSHAQIPENMLVILPHQEKRLEKSSKGTIIRKAAEERFKEQIEQAYERLDSVEERDVTDEQLPAYLIDLVQSMVSESVPLGLDTELFSYGIDSIASMRLRNHVRSLIPGNQDAVPLSIIEDCGSIRALNNYILQKRHGGNAVQTEDEEQLMQDLVKKYSNFESQNTDSSVQEMAESSPSTTSHGEHIILTGATGALGAHILDQLRRSNDVAAICCLVRGADDHAAQERVNKALEQRGLTALTPPNPSNQKVQVLKAQLGVPTLGLSLRHYNSLATKTTLIIHAAWTVNFRLKLRSFEPDNISGVKHLLDLALKHPAPHPPPRFLYCSSTAAVTNATRPPPTLLPPIPEHLFPSPTSASPLGYSRSKWVAEHICAHAHAHTRLHSRIAILRLGQLSADSHTGIWNASEAWPLMLSTLLWTRSLPDLGDEPLDWLPVDVAARGVLECADGLGREQERERDDDGDGDSNEVRVLHVLNPHRVPPWSAMLRWLQAREDFTIVSPEAWIQRLEEREQEGEAYSALRLLGVWKEAYGRAETGAAEAEAQRTSPQFAVDVAEKWSASLRAVKPVDEEYVGRIWEWVKASVI